MSYTNWTVVDKNGTITITADCEKTVNPALHVMMNKETGAIVVKGSPELLVVESTGKALSCKLELFSCIFSTYPNNWQVPIKESHE